MSVSVACFVFLISLVVSIVSSVVLAERIDQLGIWLKLSEGLLGLLTALAADSPEIASAVTAIVGGNHDLGLGVVFGSNIFNLAALLGVGAITAGAVRVGKAGLWFDGGVGLAVAVVVAVRLFGWTGNAITVACVAAILVPYLSISALKPKHLQRLPLRPRLRFALEQILATTAHEKRTGETPEKPSTNDLLGVIPALVAVIVASVGMVDAAVVLGNRWHIPHGIVGMLVLATVTGIPNMLAAIRLAGHGRGSAVVSETLNSNNVNLLAGALAPALIFGVGAIDGRAETAIVWSIVMTLIALVLASIKTGVTRRDGFILVGIYAAFVGVVLWQR